MSCLQPSRYGIKSHSFPSRMLKFVQRNAEELSSYQKKIVGVDDHLGVALAGLASDARVLSNFMKQQSLASKMTYGRPIPVERVVSMIGDRAQTNTQHYGKRPYGVGLLVAGVDELGPHLFEFSPSGMTQEMLACAIGARSQMARTYLERHLDKFADCSRDELIKHALLALKESLAQDKELTVDNTSLAVIGIGEKDGRKKLEAFKLFDGQDVGPLLEANVESTAAEGGDVMETDS
jgi:20S proteasome subunit alpha 6